MWKANGKTTTLVLFLDTLFPKVWKRLWTCRRTDYYLKYVHEVGSLALKEDVLVMLEGIARRRLFELKSE
jgi:hypothetical protein